MNSITLVTLGVADVKRSREFYRALGFDCPTVEEDPAIVFFNNNGTRLALYPLQLLAEDIDTAAPPATGTGFGGITIAHNARSEEAVDTILAKVGELGGTVVKPAQPTSWGGYSGYFRDPDGHYWEVAYGSMWQFDANGMLVIGGPA